MNGLICWLVVGLVSVVVGNEKVLQPLGAFAAVNASSAVKPLGAFAAVNASSAVRNKKNFMVSLSANADNSVGSVYFDWGRIRGSHSGGPTQEPIPAGQTRNSYNIDTAQAIADCEGKKPKNPCLNSAGQFSSRYLCKAIIESKVITVSAKLGAPDTLPAKSDFDSKLKLYECFTDSTGKVVGAHPSRGMAVKMELTDECQAKLAGLKGDKTILPEDVDKTSVGENGRNAKWAAFWTTAANDAKIKGTFCDKELKK